MSNQEVPVQKKDGSVNEKVQHSPTHEQTSGLNQRSPDPTANIVNRPYSLPHDARFGDGSDPDANAKTESTGVTQSHSHPQSPKHGHGAEGSGSTGLPEGGDGKNSSDGRDPHAKESQTT